MNLLHSNVMEWNTLKHWSEYPVVAFDTETSGGYPIESEIIELGAVKWFKGEVIGKFQTLLAPKAPLTPENIRIHGITNEMLVGAPLMSDKILEFCEFIDGSILIAHHAPFDLGFLTPAIEKAGLKFPNCLHLCTSLISRSLLHTTNHKLQTLVKELKLVGGDAHRAYDDAYACLQVFIKSCEKLDGVKEAQAVTQPTTQLAFGEAPMPATLEKLQAVQKKKIDWNCYRLYTEPDIKIKSLLKAADLQKTISILYAGGSQKSKPRPITVYGIVRNPDGDYLHAMCGIDHQRKRFYLDKIVDYEIN